MADEAAVHGAEAELAAGSGPALAADLAADGIDEWLGLLSAGSPFGVTVTSLLVAAFTVPPIICVVAVLPEASFVVTSALTKRSSDPPPTSPRLAW